MNVLQKTQAKVAHAFLTAPLNCEPPAVCQMEFKQNLDVVRGWRGSSGVWHKAHLLEEGVPRESNRTLGVQGLPRHPGCSEKAGTQKHSHLTRHSDPNDKTRLEHNLHMTTVTKIEF